MPVLSISDSVYGESVDQYVFPRITLLIRQIAMGCISALPGAGNRVWIESYAASGRFYGRDRFSRRLWNSPEPYSQGCTKTDDPGGGKAALDAIIITTSKLVV